MRAGRRLRASRTSHPRNFSTMWVYVFVLILSIAISIAMRPKPQSTKPPSLADFSVPTAEEGREVMVVFGEVWVDDPNVLAYGDLRTTPIKASGGK
jgi:hypothetical protein